jgi:hypothetical protein
MKTQFSYAMISVGNYEIIAISRSMIFEAVYDFISGMISA